MHEKLLIYGLKDDKLIHIEEVESGLKCECICPYCKVKLIARKGKIKIHHFAHDRGADCGKAYETALHLLAKEIIKERKTILLPECYPANNYYSDSGFKHPQRVINFSDVEIEILIEQDEITIKPDAICINNDIELLVEFAVTHFVDSDKINKIKKLNKNCLEVDLSSTELNKEKLIEVIENLPHYTKWIYNNHIEQDYESFVEQHFSDTKNLIENAFKQNNSFCIPSYIHRIYAKRDMMFNIDHEFDEADDFDVDYSFDLDDNNNYYDKIVFDKVLSERDIEYSTIMENHHFKKYRPNYLLIKNNKILFCHVSYPERLSKNQLANLLDKSLNVPLVLLNLNEFKYETSELECIIHEAHSYFYWISNPKIEADLLRRKEEKEEEERIRELLYINEVKAYSQIPNYRVFTYQFFEETAKYCPKPRLTILEEFKDSRFYSHPILKRIIDGELWNGKKYGDYDRGHIYINKEKIFIYKEYRLPNGELINTDHQSSNLFYAGIMNIQEALENSSGNCKKCKHLVKLLSGTQETTVVCGYK